MFSLNTSVKSSKKRKKEIIAFFVKLDQNVNQEGLALTYRGCLKDQ